MLGISVFELKQQKKLFCVHGGRPKGKRRDAPHPGNSTKRLRSFCDSNLKGERRRRGIKECV